MLVCAAHRCDVAGNVSFGAVQNASRRCGQAVFSTRRPARRLSVVRAQAEESEEDFEARLAALKKAKGETPYGSGKKAAAKAEQVPKPAKKKTYDFTNETLYFESAPHRGDLAVNVALGITLLWLPLSIAAVGRGLFVKYRFTDRRISCITSAPWQNEQLDAAYEEVSKVVSIGRGVGLWGDMVVTLNDGSKIEMRSLPRFKEMERYILQRRDELTGGSKKPDAAASQPAAAGPKGFA